MGISITRRINVELAPALRSTAATFTRNLSVSFARSEYLAQSIARSLKAGEKVVLLDVDYHSPLFGQQKTIEQSVTEELLTLGVRPELASEVINLDHHNKELGDKTSTELVFDNLDQLRNLEGEVTIFINHGDTDSLVASHVANNLDRKFSLEEKKLLVAAARAGDHSEGDFLAPLDSLLPAARLNLALDGIAKEARLEYRNVSRTEEKMILSGIQNAYQLIEACLQDSRRLYGTEVERLVKNDTGRVSYSLVRDALLGKEIPGITIDNAIEGYPIVIVEVTAPGLQDFNPIPAYQAIPNPALILIARNGRIVGVGRNNTFSPWLNLMGNDNVQSFYERTGLRIKGGAHAGGPNVPREAFDTLPSIPEGMQLAEQFLKDSLS